MTGLEVLVGGVAKVARGLLWLVGVPTLGTLWAGLALGAGVAVFGGLLRFLGVRPLGQEISMSLGAVVVPQWASLPVGALLAVVLGVGALGCWRALRWLLSL